MELIRSTRLKNVRSQFWPKLKKACFNLIRWVLILGICYIIIYPLLTKISSSFMSQRDLFDKTVQWIPRFFTFDNYTMVFEQLKYPEAFLNSFILALLVSLLQLFSCTLIGYGFARFDFKGKGLLFGLVIFTLIVPPQMIMIPMYLNFRYFTLFGLIPGGINLLGTYWPFILTSITGTGLKNGLFIFIMRQFFKGMPRGLEEAAYVDGAGPLRTFFKIMLPGAIPALVIVFLFSFVWQWNDFFLTNIYLGNETVLPMMLHGLKYNVEATLDQPISTQYASLLNNTGSLMFMAPLLLLYAFMQKYFVESIERTGLVG